VVFGPDDQRARPARREDRRLRRVPAEDAPVGVARPRRGTAARRSRSGTARRPRPRR
jgi:hypothetical protein